MMMKISRRIIGTSAIVLSLLPLLVVVVVAQGEEKYCFCPGGAPVPDPNKLVQLSASTQTTCGSLEKEATKSYQVRTYGCNYYRYYGHVCGCEQPQNEEGPIQICNLCQDEDMPVLSIERSGAAAESEPSSTSMMCHDYAIEAKFDPFRLGCGYYNFLGSLCGCVKNRPPFEGCTLCGDGSDPPSPPALGQLRVPGLEQASCENAAHYTRYVQRPGTAECIASQATFGTYCGCDPENQPKGGCALCAEKEGTTLTDDLAPEFTYLSSNGRTKIYQSGRTCLEAEMLAHQLSMTRGNERDGEEICYSIRQQLSDACCRTPKEPAAASTIIEQGRAESAVAPPLATSGGMIGRSGQGGVVFGAALLGLWELFV